MRIVIIEDEYKTAKDLQRTILSVSDKAVIAQYVESVADGITYFQSAKDIDLIFSDIQLGDGLSFEIFEKYQIKIPIIFCTAYNDYALQAFQNFGIDYILKPFSKETVKAAIDKYQLLAAPKKELALTDYSALFKDLTHHLLPKKESNSLVIFRGDKIIPLESNSIALFYIENATVYAITFDTKKEITTYKLDELEQKFYPQFFRSNRQYLINRKAIKEASQHFHRKLQIHLTIPFADTILVGKEKVSAFLDWLQQ